MAEIPNIPDWIREQLPADTVQRQHDVGGLSMRALCRGEPDEPLVVLAHGNPTWSFIYRDIMAAVDGAYLVAPDVVGLGLSDRPSSQRQHQLEQHARWMGCFIDQLPAGPIVAVVQDWGGPILMRALADRSERLAGLVVLNTVLTAPRPGFRPTLFHRLTASSTPADWLVRRLGLIERLLHLAQGDKLSIRGQVARAYRWPLRQMSRNKAPLALSRMVPNSMAHPSVTALQLVERWLGDWQGPTEIVWGTNDPVLGRLLNRTMRLLPHAKVTKTSAGHFIQEEQAELIAAAIERVVSACRPC